MLDTLSIFRPLNECRARDFFIYHINLLYIMLIVKDAGFYSPPNFSPQAIFTPETIRQKAPAGLLIALFFSI